MKRLRYYKLTVGAVTGLLGFAAIALGIFLFRDATEFAARSDHAIGEIVSVRSTAETAAAAGEEAASPSFYVTARFLDNEGEAWVLESETGQGDDYWIVGEKVALRFIPGDPPRMRVESDAPEMPLLGLGFFLIVGVPFALYGVAKIVRVIIRW